MDFIKESIASLELIESIKKESFYERIALFIWGTLIYCMVFTLFYEPNSVVTGGSAGIGQIINEITPINISCFILIFSAITQVLSFITLGLKKSLKTLLGVILVPIFMEFSSVFLNYVDFTNGSLFLTVVIGAVLMGFSNGIILKSGFSLGGFQTIYQIIYKYLRISIGKSSLMINGIIIFISGFLVGFDKVLYAIIGLYVSSIVTDKILLGTSECKTFYIITNKEKEVNQFITNNLGHSATIMDAKGGYSNDKKKLLMCAVPTRQYYLMKEVVKEIDKNSFFVATDTYEIRGGR